MLARCNFGGVPSEVKRSLGSLFTGWLTTKPIEDAMNVLTSRMDSNPIKKCQSKTRWHSLLTSSLVQDCGCSPPPVTPAVKQAAQTSVPVSVFSSAAADFSLGMDELKTISSDTSWPAPNAASWNLASYFTAAWMEVGRFGPAQDSLDVPHGPARHHPHARHQALLPRCRCFCISIGLLFGLFRARCMEGGGGCPVRKLQLALQGLGASKSSRTSWCHPSGHTQSLFPDLPPP